MAKLALLANSDIQIKIILTSVENSVLSSGEGPLAQYYKLLSKLGRVLIPTLNIEYLEVTSVNSAESKVYIAEFSPDVLFSCRLASVLKQDTIDLFRSLFNVHSGPITKYRGVENVLQQMNNRESIIGGTFHYLVAKLDAGGIIKIVENPVHNDLFWNNLLLYLSGVDYFFDVVLPQLREGNKPDSDTSYSIGTYYKIASQTQLKTFHDNGYTFINLDKLRDIFHQYDIPIELLDSSVEADVVKMNLPIE